MQILQNIAKNVKEGTAPLSSFVITKQLSKNPDAYPDKKQLSHVMVALRLNKAGGRMWKAGDILPYVICEVTILIRELFRFTCNYLPRNQDKDYCFNTRTELMRAQPNEHITSTR